MFKSFYSFLTKFLIFIALIGISAIFFSVRSLQDWSQKTVNLNQAKTVTLLKNQSLAHFAEQLEEMELIDSALKFRIWVKYLRDYSAFKAGNYRFEGGISPVGIADDICQGRVFVEPDLVLVIPEGFTLKQIAARLAARGIGDEEGNLRTLKKPELLEKYGVRAKSLEGYLYPATYYFYDGIPNLEQVVGSMIERFFQSLPEGMVDQLKTVGLSLEEAVIFASLIEMESFFEDEKPKVAEVIWNRLRRGMPLGIDAALIYGISGYGGDITWKHLKDSKNPYNTRLFKGLPPTPIGSPSVSSLKAILTPSHEGYYYYVLLPDNSKRHYFSKTLEEHNKQVKILIKAQKHP